MDHYCDEFEIERGSISVPKALLINEKEFKIDHSAENFMIDTFSLYHPFINFFLFLRGVAFLMFNEHPVLEYLTQELFHMLCF